MPDIKTETRLLNPSPDPAGLQDQIRAFEAVDFQVLRTGIVQSENSMDKATYVQGCYSDGPIDFAPVTVIAVASAVASDPRSFRDFFIEKEQNSYIFDYASVLIGKEEVFVLLVREGIKPSAPAIPNSPRLPRPVVAETTAPTEPNQWPREADAAAFFGYPPSLTEVECPYAMRMFYDGAWHTIEKIACNIRVAPSLRRILAAIKAHYQGDLDAIKKDGMDVYDGCYADRSVRGNAGKRSMHAYGAAIDMDAEHNPLGATTGRMPEAVRNIFKAEGWRWGGDYTGRKDWMHFEACT